MLSSLRLSVLVDEANRHHDRSFSLFLLFLHFHPSPSSSVDFPADWINIKTIFQDIQGDKKANDSADGDQSDVSE